MPTTRRRVLPAKNNRHNAVRACRPEIELILACCRSPRQSSADCAVLQIIDSGIDWKLLLELMDFHRVALIVGRQLLTIGPAEVPEWVTAQVRYSQREATLKGMGQTVELLRILKLLQENGVRAIPFKGSVLAQYLYGDLGLRESSDIDLLVEQREVLNIKRILASIGYLPWSHLPPTQETALIRSACVYELHNPGKGLHVELHWKTTKHPSLPFPSDFVRTREQETSIGGMQIKTLLPQALLLLLCVHGTKHSWRKLRYVCDVADTVRVAGKIDWEGLLDSAGHLGARCMVLAGLSLAHGLLEAPLPDEIQQEIQKNLQVERIAAERSDELYRSRQEEPGYWSICRFNLRSFDNWHGRLRYLTHMLLSPGVEDFKAARLPRFLFPFYPCIRLFRLFGQVTLPINPTSSDH
jgi:hypothetical protein